MTTNGSGHRVDPARTRPALRSIEPTFGAGVLSPAVHEGLNRLGLGLDDVGVVNLVTRAAAMGPVGVDVVLATFYNVNPALVASVIPGSWEKASPDEILTAQREAFSPVLAAAWAPLDPSELAELASLCRTAGEAASTNVEGRALFAGMVSQGWPGEDHLDVWHAAKLLREHRGDGHIAGLVVEGLSGIEVLVIHAAFDGLPGELLARSRHWGDEDWRAAVADLQSRGWLVESEPLTLTEDGRRRRQWIEDRTDELALVAYEPLGPDGVERMIELGEKAVAALGAVGLSSRARRPPPAS
ncbi:MAG TPA: hypothetical protein VGH94_12320 [Acidimicrobiales bacterium]|jgi:hypothetical protein